MELQQPQETKFDKDRWIYPYTNMVTIFMILFMILFVFAYTGSKVYYEKMLLSIESSLGKQTQADLAVLDIAENLQRYIFNQGIERLVKIEVRPDRIKLVLSNPILFDSGSAELKESPILYQIRELLRQIPNNVVIEGHTDNLPVGPKCKYRSNLELSGARAFSLLKFMIDGGLDPKRFRAMGCGENVPLMPNDTEENRRYNRRVEINILRD